jgi:HlyD family secretion protein
VRIKADFEKARLDLERSENLLKEGLISKAQFDQYKASYDVAKAQIDASQARIQQSQAELNRADRGRASARGRIAQQQASMARSADVVNKTVYAAPLDAIITNLPVRVGESAVPGIQNSIGSSLMTLADLSVITAEVKVDETDIINVRLGQEAEVTIDAIPNKTFKGTVTEVGSSALTRSGQAAGTTTTTGTSSQEAKDFKVGRDAAGTDGRTEAGIVNHRQNHHGNAPECVGDSHPGSHHQGKRKRQGASNAFFKSQHGKGGWK